MSLSRTSPVAPNPSWIPFWAMYGTGPRPTTVLSVTSTKTSPFAPLPAFWHAMTALPAPVPFRTATRALVDTRHDAAPEPAEGVHEQDAPQSRRAAGPHVRQPGRRHP